MRSVVMTVRCSVMLKIVIDVINIILIVVIILIIILVIVSHEQKSM